MAEHTCPNCGSALEYVPDIHALKCAFCDSVQDVVDPGEKRPDFNGTPDAIIPFSLSSSDAEAKAREVLAGNEPALVRKGMMEHRPVPPGVVCTKMERMFVPVNVDEVTYEARWSASFGYGERGEYVDWRPASGTHSGTASSAAYVGKVFLESLGKEWPRCRADRDMAEQIVEKREALAFDPVFMQEIDAEPFPAGPEAEYDESRISKEIGRQIRRHAAQGDCQRDWKKEWFEIDSKRIHTYVPLCRVTFNYRGVEYTVLLDGVDGESYLSDRLPDEAAATDGTSEETEPAGAVRGWGRLAVRGAALVGLIAALVVGWRAYSAAPADSTSASQSAADGLALAAALPPSTDAPTPTGAGLSPDVSQTAASAQPAGSVDVTAEGVVTRGPSVSAIASDTDVTYRFVTDSEVGAAILGACPPDTRCRVIGKAEADMMVSVTSVSLIADEEGAAGGAAGGAVSPSFDCSIAATDVERMICASPELSTLDAGAAKALDTALLKVSSEASANGLRRSQQIWLSQVRDRCADPACLMSAYKERIAYLAKVGD